jgi:hypothetical protein
MAEAPLYRLELILSLGSVLNSPSVECLFIRLTLGFVNWNQPWWSSKRAQIAPNGQPSCRFVPNSAMTEAQSFGCMAQLVIAVPR